MTHDLGSTRADRRRDGSVSTNEPLKRIRLQVMWNRLLALVEEQAQTLIRASFSTTVREAGDLSAGIFDPQGRMLAQAVTGSPGHVNSMAAAVPHFLVDYPLETMSPGDSYITNDPWLTSGHLHDFTIVTPAFHQGRAVALFAATIHVVDIGGRGLGPEGRQVFEEGLLIPILPIARKGVMNDELLNLLRNNNREPVQVEGDVFAAVAAGENGAKRLVDMMLEFDIAALGELADFIIESSRSAMLGIIRALPKGTYLNALTIDGYEAPVTLKVALTISDDGIHIDYAGSSPPSCLAINVVLNYTAAYSCFGARCAIAGDVLNNHGSMSPITVSAPSDCILNVQKPAPVAARHVVGHMTTEVVVGALNKAIKGGLQAECGNTWAPMLRGSSWFGDRGRVWGNYMFFGGGMGARPDKDGLSTTQFPSGVTAVPVEAAEAVCPIIFWSKEFRPNSGGPGRFRGGLGQVLEIASATSGPFEIQAMFDRVIHPAQGREGGAPGAPGRLSHNDGQKLLAAKGQHEIDSQDVLRLELPGGGGFGPPLERCPQNVAEDVAEGLVSPEAALEIYGVVLGRDGRVDADATAERRKT